MNIILSESQIVSLKSLDKTGDTSIPLISSTDMEVMIDHQHYSLLTYMVIITIYFQMRFIKRIKEDKYLRKW